MRPNIVGIAGIDGLPSEHGAERKSERGARNMFSTNGYGATDTTFLKNLIATQPGAVRVLSEQVAPRSWWDKQTYAVKAGIVVGGVAVVGVLAYALFGGKKQTAVANKRRKCSYCGNSKSSCGCATPNRKRRKIRRLKSAAAIEAALAARMQGVMDSKGVFHAHKNRKRRRKH